MAVVQLERSIRERSLLGLKEMSKQEMESILDRADYWNRQPSTVSHVLKDKFATNLFFESSTRTRCSFEVAEKRLGAEVINFTTQASSVEKGESIYDTVRTLESMGMDAGVIRLKPVGLLEQIAERVKMPLVNAGDGNNEHPTQALLDMYTMRKHFGELAGLNVTIVGDIQHSRVARSNLWALRKFGAKVSFCAPEHMRANDLDAPYISIEEAVQADVVMMLRLQLERHQGDKIGPAEEYRTHYGLTLERVAGMKPHSIIMHPAPVNRNVEIDDAVVECEQARIFDQMANGVPIRMAVMERAMA